MATIPSRVKPAYAVRSVDNTLLLLQMLRDFGELRVKEAATDLGIAPSTVHRLMSMLVYRGFAVQNESRAYLPGPSMGVGAITTTGTRELRTRIAPHLQQLRDRSSETAYFMILTGRIVRFLLTTQARFPSRSGDRDGFVLPAHTSVAGRAILSTMTAEALHDLYSGPDPENGVQFTASEVDQLFDELAVVRARGYEVGVGRIEKDVVSVSAPIRHRRLRPRAAISLSAPRSRKPELLAPGTINHLLSTRHAIEMDLASALEASIDA